MSTSISTVAFHGANLVLVSIDNKPHVAIKPICEAISLDWQAQHARIHRNPVLNSVVSITKMTGSDGKQYDMLCLPLSMLNGWLFGINANRVKNPEIRQKLIAYQFECFDVLNTYWSGKTAIQQSSALSNEDLRALECLCLHMRYLGGWWHQFEPAIALLNSDLAGNIYDSFVLGNIMATELAQKFSLPVKEPKDYYFYNFKQTHTEKQLKQLGSCGSGVSHVLHSQGKAGLPRY